MLKFWQFNGSLFLVARPRMRLRAGSALFSECSRHSRGSQDGTAIRHKGFQRLPVCKRRKDYPRDAPRAFNPSGIQGDWRKEKPHRRQRKKTARHDKPDRVAE